LIDPDALNKETLLLGKVLQFWRSGIFFRHEWMDLSIRQQTGLHQAMLVSGDAGVYRLISHLGELADICGYLSFG
jgi:hypothetical protein